MYKTNPKFMCKICYWLELLYHLASKWYWITY